MGRYTNWEMVTGRYPSAIGKGDSNDVGNFYVTGAEAELDAVLAKRYTLPMTPAPALLTDLATDMAYYRMIWMDKDRGPLLAKSIESRLNGLRDGSLVLTDSAGGLLSSGAQAWSENSYPPAFDRGSEISWEVGSSYLQDIEDRRDG